MPQVKKDTLVRKAICSRIQIFSEEYLKLGSRGLSLALGYSDPSTMRAVWKSESLPSIEKIAALSTLETSCGKFLNLNWLFTGEGDVCRQSELGIAKPPTYEAVESQLLKTLKKMPLQKQRSLLEIIR